MPLSKYCVPADISYALTSSSQLDCNFPEGRIYSFFWASAQRSRESLHISHITKPIKNPCFSHQGNVSYDSSQHKAHGTSCHMSQQAWSGFLSPLDHVEIFLGSIACTVDVARNLIHFGQNIFGTVLEGHFAQEHQTLLESCPSLLRNILGISQFKTVH